MSRIFLIDNFLNNVDELVNLSRSIEYHHNMVDPIPGVKLNHNHDTKPSGAWRGFRSDSIDIISQDLHNDLKTCILQTLKLQKENSKFESFLHLAPASIVYDDSWWHIDGVQGMAGVVYLNRHDLPMRGGGTRIRDDQGKEHNIDNVFNRLVAYPLNFMHRPDYLFGDCLTNTRLTLTFFCS